MKTVGIIQCRLNSKRCEKKMLLPCWKNQPLISCVLHRIQAARRLDDIVVAMPMVDQESELTAVLSREADPPKLYYGSEVDVVSRIIGASESVNATHIVRICADNPFVDPNLIDELILAHEFEPNVTYLYNHRPIFSGDLIHDGFGAEFVDMKTLRSAYASPKSNFLTREHMTTLLIDFLDSGDYRLVPYTKGFTLPVKIDIDHSQDYDQLKQLFESVDEYCSYLDVEKFFDNVDPNSLYKHR